MTLPGLSSLSTKMRSRMPSGTRPLTGSAGLRLQALLRNRAASSLPAHHAPSAAASLNSPPSSEGAPVPNPLPTHEGSEGAAAAHPAASGPTSVAAPVQWPAQES